MATSKRFVAKNGIDNNGKTLVNVLDPVDQQDAVTLAYFEANSGGTLPDTGVTAGFYEVATEVKAVPPTITGVAVSDIHTSYPYVQPKDTRFTFTALLSDTATGDPGSIQIFPIMAAYSGSYNHSSMADIARFLSDAFVGFAGGDDTVVTVDWDSVNSKFIAAFPMLLQYPTMSIEKLVGGAGGYSMIGLPDPILPGTQFGFRQDTGSVLFTFVTGLPANENEVQVGATIAETTDNAVAAILACTNPLVTSTVQSAYRWSEAGNSGAVYILGNANNTPTALIQTDASEMPFYMSDITMHGTNSPLVAGNYLEIVSNQVTTRLTLIAIGETPASVNEVNLGVDNVATYQNLKTAINTSFSAIAQALVINAGFEFMLLVRVLTSSKGGTKTFFGTNNTTVQAVYSSSLDLADPIYGLSDPAVVIASTTTVNSIAAFDSFEVNPKGQLLFAGNPAPLANVDWNNIKNKPSTLSPAELARVIQLDKFTYDTSLPGTIIPDNNTLVFNNQGQLTVDPVALGIVPPTPVVPNQWSSTLSNAGIALSNGGLTATSSAATTWQSVVSTSVVAATEHRYWEVTVPSLVADMSIGAAFDLLYAVGDGNWLGDASLTSLGYKPDGNLYGGAGPLATFNAYAVGDTIGVEFQRDFPSTGIFTITFYKNNVLQGSFSYPGGDARAATSLYGTGDAVTINFGATAFVGTLPVGAVPFDTSFASGYVPYVGASSGVDLGLYALHAQNIVASEAVTAVGDAQFGTVRVGKGGGTVAAPTNAASNLVVGEGLANANAPGTFFSGATYNTAIGRNTLVSVSAAKKNTSVGSGVMATNSTGDNNTVVGAKSVAGIATANVATISSVTQSPYLRLEMGTDRGRLSDGDKVSFSNWTMPSSVSMEGAATVTRTLNSFIELELDLDVADTGKLGLYLPQVTQIQPGIDPGEVVLYLASPEPRVKQDMYIDLSNMTVYANMSCRVVLVSGTFNQVTVVLPAGITFIGTDTATAVMYLTATDFQQADQVFKRNNVLTTKVDDEGELTLVTDKGVAFQTGDSVVMAGFTTFVNGTHTVIDAFGESVVVPVAYTVVTDTGTITDSLNNVYTVTSVQQSRSNALKYFVTETPDATLDGTLCTTAGFTNYPNVADCMCTGFLKGFVEVTATELLNSAFTVTGVVNNGSGQARLNIVDTTGLTSGDTVTLSGFATYTNQNEVISNVTATSIDIAQAYTATDTGTATITLGILTVQGNGIGGTKFNVNSTAGFTLATGDTVLLSGLTYQTNGSYALTSAGFSDFEIAQAYTPMSDAGTVTLSKAVSPVADNGVGGITLTVADASTLANGDTAVLSGFTVYTNGSYVISNVTPTSFDVAQAFVSTDTGAAAFSLSVVSTSANPSGTITFNVATAALLTNGDNVVLSGFTVFVNGSYFVSSVTGTAFEAVVPSYETGTAQHVHSSNYPDNGQMSIVLNVLNVSNNGTGQARMTVADASQLKTGDSLTLAGFTVYTNGAYSISNVTASTFDVPALAYTATDTGTATLALGSVVPMKHTALVTCVAPVAFAEGFVYISEATTGEYPGYNGKYHASGIAGSSFYLNRGFTAAETAGKVTPILLEGTGNSVLGADAGKFIVEGRYNSLFGNEAETLTASERVAQRPDVSNRVVFATGQGKTRLEFDSIKWKTEYDVYANRLVSTKDSKVSGVWVGSGDTVAAGASPNMMNVVLSSTYGDEYAGFNPLWSGGNALNIAIGFSPMYAAKSSAHNVAVGMLALSRLKSSYLNVGLGGFAMEHTRYGSASTAVGYQALQSLYYSVSNTAVGMNAGKFMEVLADRGTEITDGGGGNLLLTSKSDDDNNFQGFNVGDFIAAYESTNTAYVGGLDGPITARTQTSVDVPGTFTTTDTGSIDSIVLTRTIDANANGTFTISDATRLYTPIGSTDGSYLTISGFVNVPNGTYEITSMSGNILTLATLNPNIAETGGSVSAMSVWPTAIPVTEVQDAGGGNLRLLCNPQGSVLNGDTVTISGFTVYGAGNYLLSNVKRRWTLTVAGTFVGNATADIYLYKRAGETHEEASYNTFIGAKAHEFGVGGKRNVAVGYASPDSGNAPTVYNDNNVFVGAYIGWGNTVTPNFWIGGSNNTILGAHARPSGAGPWNSRVVLSTGQGKTRAEFDSSIWNFSSDIIVNATMPDFPTTTQITGGLRFGSGNPVSNQNVIIGPVGQTNTTLTGSLNTAIGGYALLANTIGIANFAVGQSCLAQNTIGSFNIALGHHALGNNLTGSSNIALGEQTLGENSTGSSNIAIGKGALIHNAKGNYNVAIGELALNSVSANANDNTAIGYAALVDVVQNSVSITSIVNGTFGHVVVTVSSTTALADDDSVTLLNAGAYTGTHVALNVAPGVFEILHAYTVDVFTGTVEYGGQQNTAIGQYAGNDTGYGSYNTYIGAQAGSLMPPNPNNYVVIASGRLGTTRAQFDGTDWTLAGGVHTPYFNGNVFTAGTGTLTIAAGKTLTANSTLTLAGVDGKTLTANNSITLAGVDGKTLTVNENLTLAGVTGKTLTVNNSLTLAGTDGQTMTFPATHASIARTDAGQSFTGTQTIERVRNVVPTVDNTANGNVTNDFVAGYTTVIGELVYLDSNAKWQKALASGAVTNYNGMLGIVLEVKNVDEALTVALPGSYIYASAHFPTFTVIGGPVYMSELTSGAVTQAAPVNPNNAVRVLGWALTADKMYFNPSPDYVTLN